MRSNDDGRNPDDSSKDPLLRELEGYVEMGMRRKACILARQILGQKRISPRAFLQVIKTIGMFSDPKKWLTELESAWQRQSAAFRRETNSEMLVLYGSTDEWEKAACHAKPRRLHSASDFLFGIEALLQVGRMKEAASAARRARKAVEAGGDEFELSCLVEALAIYSAWVGEWAEAFHLWGYAPRDQPFASNAAKGRVELHLMQILNIIREELATLRELPFDFADELTVPGNTEGMRKEMEEDLRRFQRAVERLVPEKRRQELGFTENNDKSRGG